MQIVCHVGTFHKCDNGDKLDSMLKIIYTKLITKKKLEQSYWKKKKKKWEPNWKWTQNSIFTLKRILLYKSRTKFPSKRLKK